jgi:hypothetical protein
MRTRLYGGVAGRDREVPPMPIGLVVPLRISVQKRLKYNECIILNGFPGAGKTARIAGSLEVPTGENHERFR